MALTFTEAHRGVVGSQRVWQGTATFDSAYVTGGELVIPADFGFAVAIEHVNVGSTDDAKQRVVWVAATGALKLYVEDGTTGIEAEEGSTDDASAVVVTLTAYGR
jgi:hypothetical protein